MKILHNRTFASFALRIVISPTYAYTKQVGAKSFITLTDDEYRAVQDKVSPELFTITHVDDDKPDTEQEVVQIVDDAGGGGGGGVTSLSGLTGVVTLSEGTNITLTQVGNDIEIASTGGGSGTSANTPNTLVLRNGAGGFSTDNIEVGVLLGMIGDAEINMNNCLMVDSSGIMSVGWGERQLLDNAATLSIDWHNRQLHDTSGLAVVLWDMHQLRNSTGEITVEWQLGRLLTTGGTVTAVDWDNRSLHDTAGDMTVTWRNMQLINATIGTSLDWSTYQLYDDIVAVALNWNSRQLLGTDGTTISADWTVRYLADEAGQLSVSWHGRTLVDGNDETALDWNNRVLRDPTGMESMDWEAREIRDPAEVLSMDWGDRTAFASDGSLALNYESRTLNSAGGVDSINWDNRAAYNSAGNLTLNWNNQYLSNENGQTAFSWHPSMQANTTLARPVGALAPGFMYFDTTLNQPIWWNGTTWVDAAPTGTADRFTVYDSAGELSSYNSMSINAANGIDLSQNVAPAAGNGYIKHNNSYFNATPTANSEETWYQQWYEPRILAGSFQTGNPATGAGGLNGIGMAMTASADFGSMRNFDFSLTTDGAVTGNTVAAMNQYINIDTGANVEFVYGIPISIGGLGTVTNAIGFNVNFNFADLTNNASGVVVGGNIAFSNPTGSFYNGINVNPTVSGCENATGLYVSVANVTSINTPTAIQAEGNVYINGDLQITGAFNFSNNLSVSSINTYRALNVVDGGGNPTTNNGIVSQFDGSGTIANCDMIGLSTPALINLDATFVGTSGGFGLGLCSLALPNIITMQAGCSLDNLTSAAFVNLLDAGNTGGVIDRLINCRATTIAQGGTQTVTRGYSFFADYFAGDASVDSWGFYDNGAKNNWMANSLKIGGTGGSTDKVTNSSIALELEDKAFRLARLDTAARDALTAEQGMMIFNTTTLSVETYNGTAWV